MADLDSQLDSDLRALLERYGFDRDNFVRLQSRLQSGRAEERHNRLNALLTPPLPGDIAMLPPATSHEHARWHALGLEEVRAGRVAAVVLAGGMATRFGGVVKAEVEVLPGKSFLDLKLAEIAELSRRCAAAVPVYVMTSFATHARVTQLTERWKGHGLEVHTFPQFISLRLTERGELFRDGDGKLSPYAPGHGDLVDALKRGDALQTLIRSGARHLFMSNVDNVAATLDPAIIGAHQESGAELTFEVAPLWQGDKGGVPARVNGRLQIVEALRYPPNFDERTIPLFSTNSFVFDLASLQREFELSWFRVTKKVDGRSAIQFERLVNQLAEFVRARGLLVEREGPDGRFLPVKDPAELEARRADIASVLEARAARAAQD